MEDGHTRSLVIGFRSGSHRSGLTATWTLQSDVIAVTAIWTLDHGRSPSREVVQPNENPRRKSAAARARQTGRAAAAYASSLSRTDNTVEMREHGREFVGRRLCGPPRVRLRSDRAYE